MVLLFMVWLTIDRLLSRLKNYIWRFCFNGLVFIVSLLFCLKMIKTGNQHDGMGGIIYALYAGIIIWALIIPSMISLIYTLIKLKNSNDE
jgi:hypothetical protein